jgi:hypothetical protein
VFPLKCAQCNKGSIKLNKFLGQGLGSAQPILDGSLNGNLYTDQGFSDKYNKMVIS